VFRSRSYTSSKRASDRKLSFPDHVFLWWHTLRTVVVRCRSCRRSHACPLPSIRKLRRHCRHRHRRREKTPPFKEDLPPCDQSSTNLRRRWSRGGLVRALITRRTRARTHPRIHLPDINRAVTRLIAPREWCPQRVSLRSPRCVDAPPKVASASSSLRRPRVRRTSARRERDRGSASLP